MDIEPLPLIAGVARLFCVVKVSDVGYLLTIFAYDVCSFMKEFSTCNTVKHIGP